jgi:hypothetical protein
MLSPVFCTAQCRHQAWDFVLFAKDKRKNRSRHQLSIIMSIILSMPKNLLPALRRRGVYLPLCGTDGQTPSAKRDTRITGIIVVIRVFFLAVIGATTMSPQEIQSLQDFLNQLTQVRGIAKDPQADALIASAVAQQPDAAYLLVQRALLMEQALNSAKGQIAALQSQIQNQAQSAPSRSFFDANAWGNTPTASARPAPAAAPAMPSAPAPMQMTAAPAAPVMQSAAPAASPGFFGGGIGSVLGTVATTAAGVAGGAFLFQGIEHLMHSNSGGGMMNQSGVTPSETIVENTTVNNYYGDDTRQQAQIQNDDNTNVDDFAAADTDWSDDSSMA